jgi:F-type H+-transporting ATPase subunit epsilon
MAGTFNLQIVTPEREIFNGPVESVTVPGMQSSFGVLRNHAPLIAALEPGLVDIYDAEAREIRIAVGGGFFQVAKNQAMVLADSAEIATEINVERAREAESRARSRLAGRMEPEAELQRERAEAALRRARARLRIATGG